jgi:DNA mismatch repair protein MutL
LVINLEFLILNFELIPMAKIHKLPESLIRLIAAGEVVERPASVVKELLENSLDAGATQISVEIRGAGRTRLRVSDNGEGMSRQDAEQAFERHATSKLRSFEDLQKLATLGFRGEALPSIAAVSRLNLITRTKDSPEGWQLTLEGGKLLSESAVGAPPGTTVDVQDLFFNTPARAKFLKRDSTERSQILRTLQEQALAHPEVHFEVMLEGETHWVLSASSDQPTGQAGLRRRLADLWGESIVENLLPIEFSQGSISIRGWINSVPAHHATKAYQYFFVNRRPVQIHSLTHAIYEAYHEWLPVGRHPVFVLFFDLDPAQVDVNEHPTKREVRLSNERLLYDLLFHRIRKLFQERVDVPTLQREVPEYRSNGVSEKQLEEIFADRPGSLAMPSSYAGIPEPQYPDTATLVADSPNRPVLESPRILGQFQKLYVLVERGEELLIVDQHAAAERVLYEKLLAQARQPSSHTQPLLTPFIWELAPDQAELVKQAQSSLEKLGFELDPMGSNAVALKAIPSVFPELRQAKRFLEVFIESLKEEAHDLHENAAHEAVARAACRAAIKANDPLSLPEIEHLLQELSRCQRPMTCPHGRPTHIRLPISELHRRFRRT